MSIQSVFLNYFFLPCASVPEEPKVKACPLAASLSAVGSLRFEFLRCLKGSEQCVSQSRRGTRLTAPRAFPSPTHFNLFTKNNGKKKSALRIALLHPENSTASNLLTTYIGLIFPTPSAHLLFLFPLILFRRCACVSA